MVHLSEKFPFQCPQSSCFIHSVLPNSSDLQLHVFSTLVDAGIRRVHVHTACTCRCMRMSRRHLFWSSLHDLYRWIELILVYYF